MTFESIQNLLITISQYNTVRITQTFTKDGLDIIQVKCVPGTSIVELTYLQTETVEKFDSIEEAAKVIESAINTKVFEKTSNK